MLKYQTTRGETFKHILGVLSGLLVDGNLVFTKDGIAIEGMTNRVQVKFSLPNCGSESFASWTDRLVVGLDFKILYGWLKTVSKGDIIAFEISKDVWESDEPKLIFKHWNDRRNNTVLLPVLDIEERTGDTPLLEYTSVVTLAAANLDEDIKQHCTGAQHVSFKTQPHNSPNRARLVLNSYGAVVGDTSRICSYAWSDCGELKNKREPCDKIETYSLHTVRGVSKSYSFSENVEVMLEPGAPLVLRYLLPSAGFVEFSVVPSEMPDEKELEKSRNEVKDIENLPETTPLKRKQKKKKTAKERKYDNLDEFMKELEDGPDKPAKKVKKDKRPSSPKKKRKTEDTLAPKRLFPRASQKCDACDKYIFSGEELLHDPENPNSLYHKDCLP